jgi:hypothetical protein
MCVIRTSGGDDGHPDGAVTRHRGADRLLQTTSLDEAAIARAIDALAAGRTVLLTETEGLAAQAA